MAPRLPRRRLEIHPAGGVPLPVIRAIGRAVDSALGTRHHIAPALAIAETSRADDPLAADDVLDALREAADSAQDGGITLAVAAAPLVAADGARVFGAADVGGARAVIGLGALDGASDCDETSLVDRACKTAVHECAHAAGLEHCADPTCVMYPARDIADLDRKAIGFCARCEADLAHATLDAARS